MTPLPGAGIIGRPLDAALSLSEPVPVFQPIIDLATGMITGYEALSRFPRLPGVPVDEVFDLAHRTGHGFELEVLAISRALSLAHLRPPGTTLSVNLSPSTLCHPAVLRHLPDDLRGFQVEITENELVADAVRFRAALELVRERGAQIAVDDVGEGYAGLQRVMDIRPDVLKLDRSLVSGVDSRPDLAALLEAVVRFAGRVGAQVCAEGVETEAELALLADLDVAYGQGYGIARPSAPWVPVAEEATAACLHSFEATLADAAGAEDHDRRLELLARRLAAVTTPAELEACLVPLAAELQADEVRLGAVDLERAIQLLADDPHADPGAASALRASGYGSCLTLPITHGGEIVGHLEALAVQQRPWSRFQIGRARVLCYQLGALVHRFSVAPRG